MTEFRFRFPADRCQRTLLKRAFFATWGRVPMRSGVSIEGNILSVSADIKGTGTLHVPWVHRRLGLVMQSTDTLCERERPYHLLKELGRGQLGRILRKSFEWQMFGFRPVPKLRLGILQAIREFSILATMDENSHEIDAIAVEMMEMLDNLVLQMSDQFVEQSLVSRKKVSPRFPVIFGIDMHDHPSPDSSLEFDPYAAILKGVFHSVNAMPSWRELEPEPGVFSWNQLEKRLSIPRQYGFKSHVGPLIRFEREAMPMWVLDTLDSGGDIKDHAVRLARAMAEQFGYRIDTWITAGNLTSYTLPRFPTLRAVQIAKDMANALRECGINKTILVGIDQPWGDYHLHRNHHIPIVGIAESLVSSEDIDGFLIELNLGLSRKMTLPRDPMTLGTLIDHWSYLGKKLYVGLSVPSELGANPELTEEYIGLSFDWSKKIQQEWIHRYIPMLLSKRAVCGILWNHLEDDPGETESSLESGKPDPCFAGLLDLKGKFKPAFRKIVSLRNTYLE